MKLADSSFILGSSKGNIQAFGAKDLFMFHANQWLETFVLVVNNAHIAIGLVCTFNL